ncbi:MAG: 5'-methylthioadenosine/adenosylhomocysteine nucleosidase [Hydrogenophaga sp.]|uniref:5'-methylthioadenosine/adenosylhomocysteine nucleosidase n=1 Tax=Hydrogenophaga sp. TaxID=1904254 RepID=UPI00168EDDD6|nr:5'-methylthioadenosine/adenosylhomocysteine nucleosidase [Hydrogenophaga sp.]NIM39707.1 5'-methylthioadenosine/adenosylhomocysteine nucleosidase [Hydrogenophaga sp.]NIN24911.1 5'-methylthioadenosine/adenosylhomocysteine nucleosidase [Hydrogenophaga sp.]NIN29423.1 5'-methylthioadenosine/adenosylhomocysteine nucleosidase [Hydrogenophaga sp.]NIN53946.1 5'-methylthioadenosine/adenosylhomocysteine nucleosidase [Hydrogenophaga sp.]NIO50150.1 5'-methylthioadenosine/adenosylhomocysteine nucleosidas
MTLALISAMPEELQAVLDLLPDEQRISLGGRSYWQGHLHGQTVVAVLSGIGKVAAATTTALLLQRFRVSRVVVTGVAGGIGPGVKVGDVVVANELLQHDLDASPIFPRYEVPGYGLLRFGADAELSGRVALACESTLREAPAALGAEVVQAFGLQGSRVHRGLLVTGDRFVSRTAESEALQRDLPDALAVDMESAAVAQVCADFGVPLAVVRTISDRADDAAHVDFPRFLTQVASRYSAAIVERLLGASA